MSIRSRRTQTYLLRSRRTALLVLVGLSPVLVGRFSSSAARAADVEFRIIVDPESPMASATRELVAEAFLKTSTRWPDGEAIRPVDQRPDSSARKAFSDSILKRTVSAVRSYWQQRIFSGRGVPPPELDSDEAVVKYVSGHRGAVGYVSAAAKTGETKVITVK
jgi:ABC-type phosphate transport system substrate-binding protein